MTPGIALPIIGLAVSAASSALAIGYARRRNMFDLPGPRRSHHTPTPRGGGIAPVLVVLAGGCWLALREPADAQSLGACLAGFAMVAGIGWLDDHRPLPAALRLVVHALAALAAGIALCGMPRGPVDALSIAIVAFAITSLVNAWNFMDGIDAIAASQAGLVAATLLIGGWLTGAWTDLGWLVVAAIAGFLPFNLPRARIFLGDVGSGALGFLVAILLVRAVGNGAMPWTLALLPPSAFLVDAGMTLALRILRGRKFWRPHREHAYQWLARSGWTHGRIDLAYAAWTIAASAIALFSAHSEASVAPVVSGAALLCGGLSWMGIRKRLWTMARQRR